MRHVLLTFLVIPSLVSVVQGQQAPICHDWQECRQLALEASTRGEYERFHDLAWRAVQTGPKHDPALMYLLARAQVLSGRSHDALVILQRLADMGVATDAASDADFRRTRELPGWPEVAVAIARARTATPPPGAEPSRESRTSLIAPGVPPPVISPSQPRRRRPNPAGAPSPGDATAPPSAPGSREAVRAMALAGTAPSAAGPAAAFPSAAGIVPPLAVVPFPLEPAPTSEAVRFSTEHFLAAGLAYDTVSRRFVIGDALGRKLIVVGVGSDHADDMVRAASAGFDDIVALDIDEKRGDLWVTSAAGTQGESALHRLQLVSARSLNTYRAPPSMGSTRLVDLAVQASGDVIALDRSGNRLVLLARGGSAMTVAMSLELSGARSVAARHDSVLYVAHDDGIARIDLRSGTIAALTAPKGFDLRRFDAIRAHRNALIGLQTTPAGSRQLVRLNLNATGRAVREGTVIDPRVSETDGRLSLTITGDELYYLATDADRGPAPPSSNRPTLAEQFVVRRLTLR